MQRVGYKFGNHIAWLFWPEQLALLEGIDEVLVHRLFHGVFALFSDDCLHVSVHSAWPETDACDVRLFHSEVSGHRVDCCFGGAIGAPRLVGLESRARGYPDDAALGLFDLLQTSPGLWHVMSAATRC